MAKCRLQADFAVSHLIDDLSSRVVRLVSEGKPMDAIDSQLRPAFTLAALEIHVAYQKMRRLCYTLAYVGEAEAIARADDPSVTYELDRRDLDEVVNRPSVFGGTLEGRIRYYLDSLRRRVLNTIQLAIVSGKTGDEAWQDVLAVLPRPIEVAVPRRTLTTQKRLEEAEPSRVIRAQGVNISSGFIDDEAWRDMVDEYLADEVLDRRTEDKIRFKGPNGRKTITRYEWELERDFTHDFVSLVRAGQLDVAKENGYTDFVWLSVLDNKTDECCTWRNGLTVTEIEAQLKNAHKDDTCQSTVPPAHPFCRCDLAPVTDEIKKFSVPEIGDFESWLTNP